jgi:hypothetical protein
MIILGVILLILGLVLGINVLTWVGALLVVIGAVLWFAQPSFQGGRRWY